MHRQNDRPLELAPREPSPRLWLAVPEDDLAKGYLNLHAVGWSPEELDIFKNRWDAVRSGPPLYLGDRHE